MNKFTDLQERWLQALESGEYHQGRKFLRQRDNGQDKFCCLGVACDLYDPNGWNKAKIKQKQGIEAFCFVGSEELVSDVLPAKVENAFQFINCSGSLWDHTKKRRISIKVDGRYFEELITMNDAGVLFKEIAQVVRDNPEKVFKNFSKEKKE